MLSFLSVKMFVSKTRTQTLSFLDNLVGAILSKLLKLMIINKNYYSLRWR